MKKNIIINTIRAFKLSIILTLVAPLLFSHFIANEALAVETTSLKGYEQKDLIEFINSQNRSAKKNLVNLNSKEVQPLKINRKGIFETFKQNSREFKLKALQLRRGGLDGGGGDSESQEFFKIANDLLKHLERNKNNILDLSSLKVAIETVEVEFSEKELILDGVRKEAINYPKQRRIVVNRASWDNISTVQKKSALVLHELLGIIGINDQGYRYSASILGQTDLKFVNDYSKVIATPGSYLDSYDKIAGRLTQLWNEEPRNIQLIQQFSIQILKTFYGFSLVQFKDNDFASIQTGYYLAVSLRDLAPYDPNNEAFLRISDNFPIHTSNKTKHFGLQQSNSLQLVIGKNQKHAYEYYDGGSNIIGKFIGQGERLSGCRIKLPGMHDVSYHGITVVKQFFALAINCGGLYYEIDTNVPNFEH